MLFFGLSFCLVTCFRLFPVSSFCFLGGSFFAALATPFRGFGSIVLFALRSVLCVVGQHAPLHPPTFQPPPNSPPQPLNPSTPPPTPPPTSPNPTPTPNAQPNPPNLPTPQPNLLTGAVAGPGAAAARAQRLAAGGGLRPGAAAADAGHQRGGATAEARQAGVGLGWGGGVGWVAFELGGLGLGGWAWGGWAWGVALGFSGLVDSGPKRAC